MTTEHAKAVRERWRAHPENRQKEREYRQRYLAKLKANPTAYAAYEKGERKRRREKNRRARKDPRRAKHSAASQIIHLMTKHGWMTKAPCVKCGSTEFPEAHHPSYDRPLDVIWLCRPHHHAIHPKGGWKRPKTPPAATP